MYVLAVIASAAVFVITAAWTSIAATRSSGRSTWNILVHHQTFVLTGGRVIVGNIGYSICTDRNGVTVYHTTIDLITSRELDRDGRPISGAILPSVETVVRARFWSLVAVSAAGIPFPAVWLFATLRRRNYRGFPVIHLFSRTVAE